MRELRNILSSPAFRLGTALIFGLQLLLLLFWASPMYEIDTNSFVRGGLTWDIYHNPLSNLYIGALSRIWANVYFLVAGQLLVYAFAASLLAQVVFRGGISLWLAVGVAAIEPVSLFYHYSLLAESFFISFTLISAALLIIWMRTEDRKTALAFWFGAALGLAFMAKLSAITHLALLGPMILRRRHSLYTRLKGMGVALIPFAVCYLFVLFGQKAINGGDLYVVKGRVAWDFASSQYSPETVNDHQIFRSYVEPYIWSDTGLVAHRELRRELSYLGYKDCVEFVQTKAMSLTESISACDDMWGAAAASILENRRWAAQQQFLADNLRFVHEGNYLDYRWTPGLHYYHPEAEFNYIDSLMNARYGYTLAEGDIPGIWRSTAFVNTYMPPLWWLGWLAILAAPFLYWRYRQQVEMLVLPVLIAVPWLFHLLYISYRTRFLAPYLLILLFLILSEIRSLRYKA